MSSIKGKTYEEFYGEERAKEIKKKIGLKSLNRNVMLGKHHSEETKRKIGIALKKWHKKIGFSKETKKRIGLANSISHRGLKPLEKTKEKMSLIHKKLWENPEYKKRMSESLKGKIGEKSPTWKGDKAKYKALHKWIRIYKPKSEICEKCKEKKKLELANLTGIYNRDFFNYKWLCIKCHRQVDTPLRDENTGKFICNKN